MTARVDGDGMKPVSALYGRHVGADIYVVGTGTSIRTFPTSFLEGRITIGLNQAWKVAPIRYGITIGPHINVPEFMPGEDPHPDITWITKRDKAALVLTEAQFRYADEHFYSFRMYGRPPTNAPTEPGDAGRVLDWVRRPTGDFLYQWSSISQTAVNLAANLGAANIILVGCDNASLLDNHHAHAQHTKWLGVAPDHRYMQYYEGLVEVRQALRDRGVNLVSLSPFLKLDDPGLDFERLCDELGIPTRVDSTGDISEIDHPQRFATTEPSAPSDEGHGAHGVRDRARALRDRIRRPSAR